MKAADTILLSSLIMDDRCKNKSDVYQLAFYKAGFQIEKKVCQNTEKFNCNKFRINDLNWILDKDLVELPDVLVVNSSSNLSNQELEIISEKNIKVIYTSDKILSDFSLFNRTIDDIERKIYKAKTLKYLEKEKQIVKDIEDKYLNRSEDITKVTNKLITELLNLLKEKDLITYEHVTNVSNYVDIMLEGMPEEEKLDEKQIKHLKDAALIHDIGKLTIPNQILKKSDSLNNNEYHDIKKHVNESAYLFNNKIMNEYKDIALCHHERYDGKGYPYGLKGEEIPYEARIIAILDTFDAMTGNRNYIQKKSLFEVLNIINENKGTQFDPKLVDYFIKGIIKKQLENTELTDEKGGVKKCS